MVKHNKVKEKVLHRVLEAVRKSAVKNAGAASIKGVFEPRVPKSLQNEDKKVQLGGVITTYQQDRCLNGILIISILLMIFVGFMEKAV